MPVLSVRPEGPLDGPAIERLLDLSFGIDRRRKVSYRYRFGVAPVRALCLVAEDGGAATVGAIRYWPLRIGPRPALLLGPLAIDPALRGQGVGQLLVRTSLALAERQGWRLVFLVGSSSYYARFGFDLVDPAVVMPGEDPARLLGRGLGDEPVPRNGVLLPWPFGQPPERPVIGRVTPLAAAHPAGHRPAAYRQGGVLRLDDRCAQRPRAAAEGEATIAAPRQAAQPLPLDPHEQLRTVPAFIPVRTRAR